MKARSASHAFQLGTRRSQIHPVRRFRSKLPAAHALGKSPEFADNKSALHELAKLHGIQLAYIDMAGNKQASSPEVIRELLRSWNIPTDSEADLKNALRDHSVQVSRERVSPVIVLWDGKPQAISVRIPESLSPRQIEFRIVCEDQTVLTPTAASAPQTSALNEAKLKSVRSIYTRFARRLS